MHETVYTKRKKKTNKNRVRKRYDIARARGRVVRIYFFEKIFTGRRRSERVPPAASPYPSRIVICMHRRPAFLRFFFFFFRRNRTRTFRTVAIQRIGRRQ